jgi:hypothetical protein
VKTTVATPKQACLLPQNPMSQGGASWEADNAVIACGSIREESFLRKQPI